MVKYKILFSKKACKDAQKLKSVNLDNKVKALIEIIKVNSYKNPHPYERLVGDLKGFRLEELI